MKVLLLEHPRGRSAIHFNDIANTPLSSCLVSGYIASLLQANNIETEIHDCYLARYSLERMVEEVIGKEYDVLGIHLIYSWEHTPGVLNAIYEIASRTGVPIVVYGFYTTFSYEYILKSHPSVDYVIIGEPEFTFLELSLLVRDGKDVRSLDGLAYRKGGDLIAYNKRKVIYNLDLLPFPYRTKEHLDCIGINILGSRGCYGNCTFCYINNFYGTRCNWRGRTPENICHEVQKALSSLSSRYIYFVDANFFGPGDEGQCRAGKIAEHLQDEKELRFGLECRVNDIKEISLKALANAGLKDVFLGVESGSKRSLKRMRKGTTIEQGVRAIELLRSYGIEPYIGFIMFESDSELKDIRDNHNYLKENILLNRLVTTVDLLYHPQIVLMGTDSYKKLLAENRMRLLPHSSYQGTFSFKDDRVQFLAEVISSLCHHILTLMGESDSYLYWRRNSTDFNNHSSEIADRLNQWLVEFFEYLLEKLESREIVLTDETKNKYISESTGSVNEMVACSAIPARIKHGINSSGNPEAFKTII